ncbi:hypothetical protein P7C70_g4723, partial [Phenoliferia sp. Uapishka_3]
MPLKARTSVPVPKLADENLAGSPVAQSSSAINDQTTLAALSAAGYDSVYDPAALSTTPLGSSTILHSFSPSSHAISPSSHKSQGSPSSSSHAFAPTPSIAPLLQVASNSYDSNNYFVATSNTGFPNDLDASMTGGAGEDGGQQYGFGNHVVNTEQSSGGSGEPGRDDISVEFQQKIGALGEDTISMNGKGKGKGTAKNAAKAPAVAADGTPVGEGEEGEDGSGGDGSNKPLKNTKRAAQNRAAQRAFRERKEQHVKDLEVKASSVDAALSRCTSLESSLASVTSSLTALQSQQSIWVSDRSNWEEQQRKWEGEREGWRLREEEWRRELEGLKGALEESRRMNGELRKRERDAEDGGGVEEEVKRVKS